MCDVIRSHIDDLSSDTKTNCLQASLEVIGEDCMNRLTANLSKNRYYVNQEDKADVHNDLIIITFNFSKHLDILHNVLGSEINPIVFKGTQQLTVPLPKSN